MGRTNIWARKMAGRSVIGLQEPSTARETEVGVVFMLCKAASRSGCAWSPLLGGWRLGRFEPGWSPLHLSLPPQQGRAFIRTLSDFPFGSGTSILIWFLFPAFSTSVPLLLGSFGGPTLPLLVEPDAFRFCWGGGGGGGGGRDGLEVGITRSLILRRAMQRGFGWAGLGYAGLLPTLVCLYLEKTMPTKDAFSQPLWLCCEWMWWWIRLGVDAAG
ncbi:hypothetical protein BT67DRAFT_64724 [Trichocladium antarcticum]|uniref:Uncharacterized protein n=1 Tax=Trichocladium antarcticum TaxID=1450529 RepID=A0AAN6ZCZ5_9PEZI|nr:hypothetical protein BT67DRAFT_64724 [Trichocladium antarcticum]